MKKEKVFIETKKGEKLYGYSWLVDQEIGNVVIVTGMVEHAERYDDFAQFLNKEQYNVYCIDHFGQGENIVQNEECKGKWPKSGFRKTVNVIDELVTKLRLSCKPTYLFGHSMGSFILQDYIQRYTGHISKVILCGTSGKNPLVSVGYLLAKLLIHKHNKDKPNNFFHKMLFAGNNKRIKDGRTAYDWLTHDNEVIDQYIANPLDGFVATGSFYREFLKGMRRLCKRKFVKKIRKSLSIMIIGGEDDPVGKYGKGLKKLYNMYKKINIEDVQLRIYPQMRHEVLNEIGKAEVYDDILRFLKADNTEEGKMLANKVQQRILSNE